MATNAPILQTAILVDAVIAEIQQELAANFDWLDAVFGRSQRVTRIINGKRVIVPACYCGGWNGHGENDYIEVSPDSKIGNFAYFEVDDPETIDWNFAQLMDITTPFSLIVWLDTRKVFGSNDVRDLSHLKNDLLNFLNGRTGWTLESGERISFSRIYERAENIYRGYSLDEIDNQFLLHPYAGFRFEGQIRVIQPCIDTGEAVILYDTRDATATPGDILIGKTAYGEHGKMTGTLDLGYDAIYNRLVTI